MNSEQKEKKRKVATEQKDILVLYLCVENDRMWKGERRERESFECLSDMSDNILLIPVSLADEISVDKDRDPDYTVLTMDSLVNQV